MKNAGHLPVKTRLPLSAWLGAGMATFVSWVFHHQPIFDAAAPQLASMRHLFSHASVF